MPYRYCDMKRNIIIVGNRIECPIIGNDNMFSNKELVNDLEKPIIMHKTTFIYHNFEDNILWNSTEDIEILKSIMPFKRDNSKLGHEKSEDALTWNVFYYLTKHQLLDSMASFLSGNQENNSKILFWGYDFETETVSELLLDSREKIGEMRYKGTEPDIVIISDQSLFIIEAKFTSTNDTVKEDAKVCKSYDDYATTNNLLKVRMTDIASRKIKRYELARDWLLGNEMGKGKKVYLINLVLNDRETGIETKMESLLNLDDSHHFKRMTWENIYYFIRDKETNERNTIMDYFKNKTAGYNNGKLIKAFSL